jgi:multiple sugar transport system substrate-binding protein
MATWKRTGFLMVVMLALFSLFGSVAAQDDAPVIAPQPCEAPGTLTMWVWDENWATVIGDAIDAWKADYCPGAEVDLVQQPWEQYWDLLQTNAASGDLPDVFNMSQDRFYFYASNDTLLDLQPFWDQYGIDTTTWGTGLVDPYRWGEDGDLYAGPVNWDTIGLYYNKDLFDAAGLDYPTADWTWDDFADAAAALTDPENDVYGAAVYTEYQGGYANWIAATDTTPIVDAERTQCTLTESGSIEALTFLKNLYDQGFMPSVSILGGSSADDSFNYWLNGHVAMVTGGSWKLPQAMSDATFEWDVTQLPKNPETGISRPILHSVGYVASARSQNPDLAANLILYLVSDEGQQFFADAGGVAPANPGLQEDWIASFGDTDKNIQAFVDALPDTQGVTPFAEIWDAMNTELVVNIFDLDMSVEEATQQACDFINTQLPE